MFKNNGEQCSIENDLQGLNNYISAPNIRNKVIHLKLDETPFVSGDQVFELCQFILQQGAGEVRKFKLIYWCAPGKADWRPSERHGYPGEGWALRRNLARVKKRAY